MPIMPFDVAAVIGWDGKACRMRCGVDVRFVEDVDEETALI